MDSELVNRISRTDFNNRIMSNFYHAKMDEFKENADRYESRSVIHTETIMRPTVNTGTKENKIT